jgi:hypothetical protein
LYGHLKYFMVLWYVLPRQIWQPWQSFSCE